MYPTQHKQQEVKIGQSLDEEGILIMSNSKLILN